MTDLPYITIPRFITRTFIQQNVQRYIFLFASDVHGQSYHGQCFSARGEPNCFPIPTKYRLCKSNPNAYFNDGNFGLNKEIIDTAFHRIPTDDARIIVSFPRIGCGCAELPERAPQTLEYIKQKLKAIAYANITWDGSYQM